VDNLVDLELEAIVRVLTKGHQDPGPQYIKQVEIDTWKVLYENGHKGGRTGLGLTAMADMVASLGITVDGAAASAWMQEVMRTKLRAEFDSSIEMSIERGQFEDFNPAIENTSEFVQMMEKEFPELYDRMMKFGRRNISISTVAPTGTLSMLAQTSSGIEP